jgi:pyridoxamine 5'-phosphate oxidase
MTVELRKPYHRVMSTEPHAMNPFTSQSLPEPLPADPLAVAREWIAEARARDVQPNPNAMVLATVGANGQPSARVVLCKDIVVPAGYLQFFTNYESHKGRELAAEPRAAVVFHWDDLHRQVRVEGTVVRAPAAESDQYFASRPWQSRVGAWASQQSRPVDSRATLVGALRAAGRRFQTPPVGPDTDPARADEPVAVPRPPHWGGYRLWAAAVELWVEGAYRIHDRARYTRALTPAAAGEFGTTPWSAVRLQP